MRTVELKHLRPGEILEEQNKRSIIYLPIGPLEWHGPAMPYGTDPMLAEYVAIETAKQTGGVVMPTLYCGTERERSPELLEAMGFEDTTQYIVGQDFPRNSMKSYYSKEDYFSLILRHYLEMMIAHGYRLIVVVNGHGATNQAYEMERLEKELSNEYPCQVISISSFVPVNGIDGTIGHGNMGECSTQMYLNPEDIDLSTYPAGEKLKSSEWGINDIFTYMLQPNEDKTVQGDPREATAQYGKEIIEMSIRTGVAQVEEAWKKVMNELLL